MRIGTTMKPFNVNEISNRCQVVDHLAFNMDKIFKEESMTEILGTNSTWHYMEQRTAEWYLMRKGVFTGSSIGNFVRPNGKPYTEAAKENYYNTVLAGLRQSESRFLEQAFDSQERISAPMKRGTDLEPEALQKYMQMTDYNVEAVGFIKHNDYPIGCSPDGVIESEHKGVEIKVPLNYNHTRVWKTREVPEKYYGQLQMCMWLTGYKQWDFFSYCEPEDNQPSVIITVAYDEEWVKGMLNRVIPICHELFIDSADMDDQLV